ncbi:hypothetical protein OSTOST_11577 [Ostertagia ostertagi]
MLLWHGSRTSNFYNILSQGLRIAPPEVPSQVALGEPQILRDANYSADKLEQGKNSTLGLGKFRPSEGNFMTM